MTANEFQEGRRLRPNFSFVQADQPAARLLPCRGDTFCRAPNPDRLAGEGMDLETTNGAFALFPPSREPTATGKSCLATEACDNAAEHPATISVRAFRQPGAGRRTARSGGMHVSGSGRRPARNSRLAECLRMPGRGDGVEQDANDPRMVAAARTCQRPMQLGRHEAPGSARERHRGKASHDDWALRHLPVLEDGCLGAPAGPDPDSILHSPGVAAPSNES